MRDEPPPRMLSTHVRHHFRGRWVDRVQYKAEGAANIGGDLNLAARVDPIWHNTTHRRPHLLFAQAQWAERFDAR
ncbi:hypothetical protein N7527_003853 [Penicillium freii]|nr:hypothetical protein N7527_003853 [Penicillium freii]